jgi:hypothetical protein
MGHLPTKRTRYCRYNWQLSVELRSYLFLRSRISLESSRHSEEDDDVNVTKSNAACVRQRYVDKRWLSEEQTV